MCVVRSQSREALQHSYHGANATAYSRLDRGRKGLSVIGSCVGFVERTRMTANINENTFYVPST